MSERVLVTGVQGCLGAWAARAVLDDGDEAIGFDLGDNLERLRLTVGDDLPRVRLVRGDITDLAAVEAVLDEHGITRIVHLAALQVPFCRADPARGAAVNVVGTTNVFLAATARRDRIPGVAYASSAAVYGAEPSPGREDAGFAPATVYGVYKMANEGTARVLAADAGLATIGIRPYIVYGPGRDQGITSGPTMAVAAAVRGERYHIAFGGSAGYDYADDVGRAFVRAAHAVTAGAVVGNYPGTQASVGEIVAAIETVVPEAQGSITWDEETKLPFPPVLEAQALERVLGPLPRTSIVDGIAATVEAFRRTG